MKIIELIQRVQSLYSKGLQSDDSRLSNRLIYNKLLSARTRLIAQKLRKKQNISRWNFQVLPCVEMERASIHECPCVPVKGCQIMKSKHPLPKPIMGFKHMIESVTSLDGKEIYEETTWKSKKYEKGNKYTKTKSDYFIRNNHLFITQTDLRSPVVVTIEGLFEDPVEVENFTSYCPKDSSEDSDFSVCEPIYNKEFPIEGELVEVLIELAVGEVVLLFSQSVEDLTNNANDGTEQQSK